MTEKYKPNHIKGPLTSSINTRFNPSATREAIHSVINKNQKLIHKAPDTAPSISHAPTSPISHHHTKTSTATETTDIAEKPQRSTRTRKWIRRVALGLLGLGSLGGLGVIGTFGALSYQGSSYLEAAEDNAQKRLAIPIYTRDPDSNNQGPIGHIYGATTGIDERLYGLDKTRPIFEYQLEHNGPLEIWYQALMLLEDRGHEGGLSDTIGIDPVGMVREVGKTLFKSIKSGKFKISGGASTIGDQACGAMNQGLEKYEKSGRVGKFWTDRSCATALAREKSPERIAALYGSFDFLALGTYGIVNFAEIYLGKTIEELTPGDQCVIAGMAKRKWKSNPKDLEKMKTRGKHAAKLLVTTDKTLEILLKNTSIKALIEKNPDPQLTNADINFISEDLDLEARNIEGQIARSKLKQRKQVLAALYQQIDRFNPKTKDQVNFDLQPTPNYAAAINLAVQEAVLMFGEDWRKEVRSLTLSLDPNVQFATKTAVLAALDQASSEARAFSVVIDDYGQIIAIYSGGKEGFDFPRHQSPRSPDSIGKIAITAALGQTKYTADSPELTTTGFRRNLSKSLAGLAKSAQNLSVDPRDVDKMISKCYGSPRKNHKADESLVDATMGDYEATPWQTLTMFQETSTGKRSRTPRVVSEFVLRDKGKVKVWRTLENFSDYNNSQTCFKFKPRTDDFVQNLLREPLKPGGTMSAIDENIVAYGKTGTGGKKKTKNNPGTTNRASAIGATKKLSTKDGKENRFFGYTIIGGDTANIDINVPGKKDVSGGHTAAPTIEASLKIAIERFEDGKIKPPHQQSYWITK